MRDGAVVFRIVTVIHARKFARRGHLHSDTVGAAGPLLDQLKTRETGAVPPSQENKDECSEGL